MTALCIYHGNCLDGFASAWVVRRALGEGVEFFAGHYGNPPPDVAGRDVLIVDFSYPRGTLDVMADTATSVTVLDHHKTAAADLMGLPLPLDGPRIIDHDEPRLTALFDMERSGAGITWDYFNPDQPRPLLLDLVEDRDLWQFRLSGTREVCACLASHDYDFKTWDVLVQRCESDLGYDALVQEGQAITRRLFKDINELLPVITRQMMIGGVLVPVANLPPFMASEAGNMLAGAAPFAATYFDTGTGRLFSLRSTAAGMDVSEVARSYGGGGHRNAAGFKRPLGWEGDL